MYVPNTPAQQQEMLTRIGLDSLEQLFSSIPEKLRFKGDLDIPPALTELELTAHMQRLAGKNVHCSQAISFLGGGCYDHFVPATVDAIASRSEYYTAYTPYQAEASQGTLQVGFEFQTLICQLTQMDVSNASLYEGATSVVEAVVLAINSGKNLSEVVVSETVHPEYRQTLETYLNNIDAKLILIPSKGGVTDLDAVKNAVNQRTACVVVQSPNFFGCIEPVAQVRTAAGESVLVQVFDPVSLGLLRRPGQCDVDIAVGEGQSLGTPMSYGGPFLGLFACREKFVRKIPGRLVGETIDSKGRRAFVLTLQTREQHIRREKATSNICTNQGLLALRASIYLSLLGPQGLKELGELCWHKSHYAAQQLAQAGLQPAFDAPFFKEFVVRLPGPAETYLPKLLDEGFHAGVALDRWYPNLKNHLLVAVTEKRTREEIDNFAAAWKRVLS